MRGVGLLACVFGLIAAASPEPQKKTSPPPAKKASAATKKQLAKKKTTKQQTASKKPRSKKRRPSWRASQQTPTRERYVEIQQALISKGYEPGPATGGWGPEWVEALKKFQSAQSLEPSGKLDSLSLIALGLGPKRQGNGAPPSAPPSQTPPTSSEPRQP